MYDYDNSEYYEGKVAHFEGCEADENPYNEGSPNYLAWEAGWEDAAWDER